MNHPIRVPRTTVLIAYTQAYCPKCQCGNIISEEFNEEFHTGADVPEHAFLLGTSCKCGGIFELNEGNYHYTRDSYVKLECQCGVSLSIYRDGQQCKCGQMYNAVGQRITHKGYDAYGDTDY